MNHAAAEAVAAPTEDPFGGRAFISPAKIRILLTPAGPDVTPAEFEKWAAHVRQFESIAIADLPPSQTGRAGPAPGSPLHKYGEIHISFVTSYDPSHAFLAPFALHKQVLGVLGLGSFKHDADRTAMDRAPSALRELHPNAIVHRAYIFDTAPAANDPRTHSRSSSRHSRSSHDSSPPTGHHFATAQPNDDSVPSSSRDSFKPDTASQTPGFSDRGNSGLVIFPAIRKDGKDVRFYLRTLLREFIGSLLDGLDSIVKGLEGKSLETPRETLDGLAGNTYPAPSPSSVSPTSPTATTTASSAASRASSFFSSFASGTSTSSSSPTAVGGGMQPSLLSSSGSGTTAGQSSSASKSALSRSSASSSTKNQPQRTTSMVGAGPTGSGRYAKVKADYALLSGDLWAAISGYDSCLSWLGKERAIAGGQDAVWFANALEHWAVTRCLIFRMSGLEEKGPSLNLPSAGGKDKDKKETLELPFSRFEWGEVAEAYALALQIYSKTLAPPRYLAESARSVTNDTPRDYTHPLIHASACIAYSRLLLAVWASSGWNAECFDQLIYGGVPPALVEDARPGSAMYASLSKASGVQRHEIAAPASLGLSHSVAALKPPDQIHILCSLANIYGCIGFPRREAYLLRQLQAAVVSLLARALILHPREPVTISAALKQIAGSDHIVLGTLVSQTLTSGLGEGADAVLILALQICETYGINVDVDPLRNLPSHHVLSKAAQTGKKTATGEPLLKKKSRASWGAQAVLDSAGLPHGDLSILQEEAAFGWADLQIALLKDTICVAEMLQDHVGMAFFAAILVRDFHELLSADEQQSLIRGLHACVRTARMQDAHDLEVQYWGPAEPLCSLETVPLPTSRLAVERPAKELAVAVNGNDSGSAQVPPGTQNPFFWNPSTASNIAAKQSVLVQDEPATFLVTLQNPFKTPLDLSSVRLSTHGAQFDAAPIEVSLPPMVFHTIALSGIPRESGAVTVRGVFLTLQGCKEREFKVPLHDEPTEKRRQQREAMVDDRRTRLKTHGLDARPAMIAQKRAALAAGDSDGKLSTTKKGMPHSGGLPSEKFVTCKVIPSQPQLLLSSPSLSHGSILLYEGEKTTMSIRLTNPSSLPVDFVQLSATDDLTEAIQASLSEGNLLASDVHQLEHQLLHAPVFSALPPRDRPRSIRVPPNGRSVTIPIEIRGKLDCTRGVVSVDFGYVTAPGRGGLPTEESRNFYTRRAVMPFGITVVPLVESMPLDVKEIGAIEADLLRARLREEMGTGRLTLQESKLVNGQQVQHGAKKETSSSATACLLTLDLRNIHEHPVKICVNLDEDEEQGSSISVDDTKGMLTTSASPEVHLAVTRTLAPGQTASISVPLSKFNLPASTLSSPIPSLSSRQFIVSKVKMTPQEEASVKRRFWYRQALLSRLSASWTDVRSGKTGVLGLEEQQLSDVLVARLREDPLEVQVDVAQEDAEGVSGTSVTTLSSDTITCHTTSECFRTITSQVTNRSGRALRLLHRLVPLPSGAIDAWSSGASRCHIGMISDARNRNSSSGNNNTLSSSVIDAYTPLHSSGTHSNDATLSQLLITDGGLGSPVTPWPLEPGQSATVSTGVTFLASGSFAFTACVEEAFDLGGGDAESQRERLSCVARRQLIVNVDV